MSFNIEVAGGTSVRLPTAGKYCDRDILVTATGGEDLWQYVRTLNLPFDGTVFPVDYELVMNLPFISNITSLLQNSTNLKKLTLLGGASTGSVGGTYCFTNGTITEIDFSNFRNGGIQFGSSAKYPFHGCSRLKYIRGEIDMSIVTSTLNYFYGCGQLVDVEFKKESIKVDITIPSSNLSDNSIQSIIDGLVDLTGTMEQTLTLTSTVGAKLTDAQKASITAKNWTLVY